MELIETGKKIPTIQTEIPRQFLKHQIGMHKVTQTSTNKFLFIFFSYHFFHSIALLATPLAKRPYLTGSLMVAGTLLFSGTCYYAGELSRNYI